MAKSIQKKTTKATKSRQPARKTTTRESAKSRAKTNSKRIAVGVKKSTAKARTPALPGGSNGSRLPENKKSSNNPKSGGAKGLGSSQPVGSGSSPAEKKPVKVSSGLKAKDLAFFRELLLAKRRELIGDVHSMEQEALQTSSGTNLSNLPVHMADMGTDNYEQEFTLGLVEKDRQLLREINVALQKIRDGSYGICEGTGQPISRARLEAQPWARYSIEHARQMEKGKRPPMMQMPFR